MLINFFYTKFNYFFITFCFIIIVCYFFPNVTYFFCLFALIFAIYDIIKSYKLRIQSYILWCIIISFVEIISRISGFQVAYEFGKYSIILLSILLFLLNSIKPKNYALFSIILLLLPGIFIGKSVEEITIYKNFAFYMIGQFCIIFSLVCLFNSKISLDFYYLVMKLIFISCFLLSFFISLVSPSLSELSFSTEANFQATGGFGPNQVSTVLGFGLFSGFILIFNNQSIFKIKFLDTFLILFLTYRLLLSFSRGGASAAVFTIILFLVLYFMFSDRISFIKSKKFISNIFLYCIVIITAWIYIDNFTEGVLSERYIETVKVSDENELSISDTRVIIAQSELMTFNENIFFGAGVGGSQKFRLEYFGMRELSHNEITRLLGDHGLLGLMYLLILFILIILKFLNSEKILGINNVSLFFLAILTLLHSSTRLSFSCFILSLSFVTIINLNNKVKNNISKYNTLNLK